MVDFGGIQTIEKLDRNNYGVWSFKAKVYLEARDLWEVIENEMPEEEEMRKIWVKKNKEAMNMLVQSLSANQTQYVINQTTASGIWNKLKGIHKIKSLEEKLNIKKEINTFKWRKTDSSATYMERLQNLIESLRSTGGEIDEAEAVAICIQGLPKEFSKVITAYHMGDISSYTLSKIKYALIKEEELMGEQQSETEEAANRIKCHRRHDRRVDVKSVKCFKCGKYGHFAKNCRTDNVNRRIEYDSRRNFNPNCRTQRAKRTQETDFALNVNCGNRNNMHQRWLVDSAATSHMTGRKECFTLFTTGEETEVELADGTKLMAEGNGEVRFQAEEEADIRNFKACNVLYVPKLKDNLLSVRKLTSNGVKVIFDEDKCRAFDKQNRKLIFTAEIINGLYTVNAKEIKPLEHVIKSYTNDSRLWHRRLAHANFELMKSISNNGSLRDFKINDTRFEDCEECIKGKHHRRSFKSQERQSKEILDLIHVDLCGPMGKDSIGGSKYMVVIIDDYSRKIFVYFIRQKGEAGEKLKGFILMVERETGKKLKRIRTDNGTEFVNTNLRTFFEVHGIKHEKIIPGTPQQNGVVERANRSITETVRTLLADSHLPLDFWAEAAATAVHIINRCEKKLLQGISPEELWTKRKPTASYFKVFGCLSYTWIPKAERSKLEEKSKMGIFIGYSFNRNGYRIYDPKTKNIYDSTDVKFLEDKLGSELLKEDIKGTKDEVPYFIDLISRDDNSEMQEPRIEKPNEHLEENDQNVIKEDSQKNESSRQREKRTIKRPQRLQVNPKNKIYKTIEYNSEPITYEEAVNGMKANEWRQAIKDELSSHEEMNTWTLIQKQPGFKIIKSKWVFKIKDGKKYKARLVAVGCAQERGRDYQDTYSPVLKLKSLRTLLAIANKENLELQQLDVKTAYLHGELEEDIYMEIPQGLEEHTKGETNNMVCKLNKAIYGLKQSGRVWNKKIDDILRRNEFKRCESDRCIYVKRSRQNYIILGLYVDDILIASNHREMMEETITKMKKEIQIKDLGEPKFILGIRIERDRENRIISMDQEQQIDKILQEYGMEDCKTVRSPMEERISLPAIVESSDDTTYQSIIGSLMYLVQGTRPDIAFSTHYLSQFNNSNGSEHMKALKRILRYLKGTKKEKLIFTNEERCLEGFSDANWNVNGGNGKSTSGYIFTLNGTAISWRSIKQSTVALSTCEAEYIALTEAAKEGIWFRMFLEEIGFEHLYGEILSIRTDNQSAKYLAENPINHQRTKHIRIKYHFIRDELEKGLLQVLYVPSEDNIANGLTKSIGPQMLLKEKGRYKLEEN